MSDSITAPVIAGLAVGIGFITLFSLLLGPTHSTLTPEISPESALEIAEKDLRERSTDIVRITPYVDFVNPDGVHNRQFPLIYLHPNGTQYYINSTTSEIESSCNPSTSACLVYGQDIRDAISGRLTYLVDLVWFHEKGHSSSAIYHVDAKTEEIVYRPPITTDSSSFIPPNNATRIPYHTN